MSRAALLVAVVCACGCSGAASAGGTTRSGHCVSATATPDVVDLVVGRVVTMPPSCPEGTSMRFASAVRLTPTDDGLQLQFDIDDPAFAATSGRTRSRGRGLATVYPEGEGPGRPAVELGVERSGTGYRVDDIVPWETWGLHRPEGAFHFVCVLTDRTGDGTVTSLRLVLHVRVRAAA